MFYNGTQIIGKEGKEIKIVTPAGINIKGERVFGINCKVGIIVTEDGGLILGKECEEVGIECLDIKNR